MAVIEQFLIALGFETKDAQKELKTIEQRIGQIVKVAGSIAGAFGIKALLNDFINVNSKISTLSNTLGEDYEQIQVWGEAVKSVGGSVEGLESSITSLNSGIQQTAITGNSALLPVLNRMGISIRNGNGDLKQGTDLLLELSGTFSKLTDRQANTFGKQLGLDTGTIMLLKQGTDNVNSLLIKQRELGVYTKKDGETTQAFKNSLDDLMQVVKSIMAVFARIAIPIITKFNEALTSVALFIRKYENFIKGFFIGIAIAIGYTLIPVVFGLIKAFLMLNSSMAIIILIGVAVGLLVDDFLAWKNGGKSLFGDLYNGLERFYNFLIKVKDVVKTFIEDLKIVGNYIAEIPGIKQVINLVSGGSDEVDVNKKGGSMKERALRNQQIMLERNRNSGMRQTSNTSNNSSNNSSSNSSHISIGKVEITTQATDSQGIANTIKPAIESKLNLTTNMANGI